MKKIVLISGIVCTMCCLNTAKAQTTPVLAAFSVEEKKPAQEAVPAENTPKIELAAYGSSPTPQTNEREKEVVPVLAASGQEPPKNK